MAVLRKLITTDLHGTENGGGNTFNTTGSLADVNAAIITRVIITSDAHLRSITLHYGDTVGTPCGSSEGTRVEHVLEKGEFITTVEGTSSDGAISKIQFETNKGRKWGPWGRTAHGTTFVWSGFPPGVGLFSFNGTADSHIRTLRGTFAAYNTCASRPSAVKYEKHVDTGPDSVPLVPVSNFATYTLLPLFVASVTDSRSNLMSPTVTLLIGSDATVFHASQDILCRLPFFRAALQGEFREAADRRITMPEDEPQTVAALLEFLYTGCYTYPYHTPSEATDESDGPAADLDEGAYHVGVYATAYKYGCTGLVEAALKGFMFVLGQLKGVDVLRLWKGAYAKDLLLKAVTGKEEVGAFRTGLPTLLKEMYTAHPTEMERTSVDYPALLHDLLRLVVCNE